MTAGFDSVDLRVDLDFDLGGMVHKRGHGLKACEVIALEEKQVYEPCRLEN